MYWVRRQGSNRFIESASYDGTGATVYYDAAPLAINADIAFHPGASVFPSSPEVYWKELGILYRGSTCTATATPTVIGADPFCPLEPSTIAPVTPNFLYYTCETNVQIYQMVNGITSNTGIPASSLGTIRDIAFHGGLLYVAIDGLSGNGAEIWTWDPTVPILSHFATIPPVLAQAQVRSIDFDRSTGDLYVLGKYGNQLTPDEAFIVRITNSGTTIPFLYGNSQVGFIQNNRNAIAVDGVAGFVFWTASSPSNVDFSQVRRATIGAPSPPIVLASTSIPGGEQFLGITTSQCTTCGFILGDINLDGQVNLLDVEPFVELLSNGDFQIEADVNEDGTVNLLDVGPFIDILSG